MKILVFLGHWDNHRGLSLLTHWKLLFPEHLLWTAACTPEVGRKHYGVGVGGWLWHGLLHPGDVSGTTRGCHSQSDSAGL